MAHPAESTHWYTREGVPAYTIVGANGKERPTTLRDARKLSLVPSVTSVIKCAAAPGLERWKQEQVLHAALTLPKIEGESEAAYLDRIWTDSREQGRKAMQRGTDIHAAIQTYYETKRCGTEWQKHVDGTVKAVDEWLAVNRWTAEKSFSHRLGFGGKCDLSAELISVSNCKHSLHAIGAVVDFKTTEKDLDTIKTWDEHALQLAAYREGLGMPEARCAIVYVSVTNPGEAKVIELPEEELQRGWRMFKALLDYWIAKTGYQP